VNAVAPGLIETPLTAERIRTERWRHQIFIEQSPLRRVGKPEDVARAMLPYIERHLASGGKLNQITRHMLGLFAGRPGARGWRRLLSEQAHRPGAGPEVVEAALAQLEPAA
jgi:tRNA-dihydrouridine synthase